MITLTFELNDPGDKRQEALDAAWRALASAGFNVFRGKAEGDDIEIIATEGPE